MKKVILLTLLIGSAFFVCAQITLSSGSQIIVASGSTLVVNDVVNTSGTITNSGTVSVKGDVTNNGGGLIHSTSTGTVTFTGSSAQEITGTTSIHFYGTMDVNNSNGVSLTNTTTGTDHEIHGALSFTSGKLTLNGFHLTVDGTADPSGVGATSYIVTNGAGELKRTVGANNILFPVGNSAYNPVIINNAGDSDTYGVIAVDSKPASFSGTEHIVNRSWNVTEGTPGGSNFTLTSQWNETEEATAFDRTNSCVGITADAGANVTWGAAGAASGGDPYTQNSTGYTSIGTFMVGDYYYGGIVMDLKVILAAAWNSTDMDKTLNTAGLIPLTDPYSVGVTVSSVPANAVDWVKVELRSSSNNATVTNTYAKFVDTDGQIIEEDGSNMKLTGAATGSYFVAVQHRNHFGVVSASTVDIASSPTVDFSGLQATAYQDGTISTNPAMKEVESGVFGLWDGDVNEDGSIKYNGSGADRVAVLTAVGSSTPGNVVSTTYSNNDANMDGDIKYNGASADRVVILSVVGSSTPGVVLSEHIPE